MTKLLSVLAIATIAHSLNKAYCHQIDDHTQPSWPDAPDWQKESAINGVKFHLENPDASPASSHENWYKEKELAGWKYGPVKNPDAKEHPCFVPYDQLPIEQKVKDTLFKSVIAALEPMADKSELAKAA